MNRVGADHKRQVFPHLADKRMNELTEKEQDDAREDWIRANHAFTRDPEHISFLLRRIDALRDAPVRAALADMFALIDEGWLVREIEHDRAPDWAMKQLQYVRRLAACKLALESVEVP